MTKLTNGKPNPKKMVLVILSRDHKKMYEMDNLFNLKIKADPLKRRFKTKPGMKTGMSESENDDDLQKDDGDMLLPPFFPFNFDVVLAPSKSLKKFCFLLFLFYVGVNI
ncbi:hypothetical protein PPYR_06729 [Photinus pyralis]|uniref:Uncharacterized protein n=1 Tax=Photinus pyralis TaxID=7054 RepID=A0A5N4ANE2_PHOPY|nr:hypothetical protein PPYR_06729 [Photinus pyralis]